MKYCFILFFIPLSFWGFSQPHNLDYFLQHATQNSPGLKDFQNQVLSLQIDSQLLKASLGPQVNFLSTNSYAPIINGWGYDEAITNRANISGLIQASRNYLSRGQISAQYRTIALQRRSLLDTIALSQQDLARTITEKYIAAYGDLLAMDFNREVYAIM